MKNKKKNIFVINIILLSYKLYVEIKNKIIIIHRI